MAKIFVALPVIGGFYPMMTQSLLKMVQENPGGHEFDFHVHCNESLISRARNLLAHAFLNNSDAEYLVSIDADLQFKPDSIDRLVRHDLDIVAAPYVVKSIPPRWAVHFLPDLMPPFVEGLLEVRYVSTGFTLVKRHVFEALKENSPVYQGPSGDNWGFYNPFIHEASYLSEDWAFCERARQKGFRLYCDFGIELQHYGFSQYAMPKHEGKMPLHALMPLATQRDAMEAAIGNLTLNRLTSDMAGLVGRFQEMQEMVDGILKLRT